MTFCPYCSSRLIRFVKHRHEPERYHEAPVHWFCRHCWQEIPEVYLERVEAASGEPGRSLHHTHSHSHFHSYSQNEAACRWLVAVASSEV